MPSCDVIIPVWNQIEDTKRCIESLRENNDFPHGLIIVDNGSRQPARGYLEGLSEGSPDIVLLRNEKNEGFVKAVNRAIALSKADYVCILNNDTIVTKGWLGEMIKVAELDDSIGIVNPSSNNLGQRPAKGEGIKSYAERLKESRGRYSELGTALGFCMLIKRTCIEKIGVFDEIFSPGNFEDTDFSLRAKAHGLKSVRAIASYVYHKENASFRILKDYKSTFQRNKRIFEKRWGRQERIMVVLGSAVAHDERIERLIKKEADKNNWVYVASKKKWNFSQRHNSRVHIYDFTGLFGLKTALKIILKKKKFDRIYCDTERYLRIVKMLKPLHGGEVLSL